MPVSTVYTQCGGTNRSPDLRWSGAPAATKSFVLIVHDPDAPHRGGWYHWAVYDMPAGESAIGTAQLPQGVAGTNDFGHARYDGPCPPPGKPHHYHFTLYALDAMAPASAQRMTAQQAEQFAKRHAIAQTTLTGIYGR